MATTIPPLSHPTTNQNSYGEILTEMIVNGAASLYGKMVEEFTNVTMTNITEGYGNKLLPSMRY